MGQVRAKNIMITAKILAYNGQDMTVRLDSSTDIELLSKQANIIEIRLTDDRRISAEQRKKIFAIIKDVSLWSGHEPEYLREYLTWDYRSIDGIPKFSLSNTSVDNARGFINHLINFCLMHNVPTSDSLVNRHDNTYKYLYMCLEHKKCAICNKDAEVHHVDKVGMGRDREHISHKRLKAISLCRKHHTEAHMGEKELFDKYKIYGIELDEYLCSKLNL